MAWFPCNIGGVSEQGGEIKTLVYTLGIGGQWETFQNPAPDNGMLLYEVKDSNGDIVLSVKKKISDLPIYNAYVALGVFDTNKTINAARSSDNSTIYLSVNTAFTGYSLKVYTFEPGGGSAIEDYTTNYFPVLLDSNYYTVFSKVANDEVYNGGRGGTRASSDPVFYFCCKTASYWGYGLIGLTSASVQVTATTTYGSAVYYTQTTTNGNTVYLARLASMNGGQSSTVFKNGYLKIEIDGSQYVEQDGSTDLFDQTFVDAAYEALTALS